MLTFSLQVLDAEMAGLPAEDIWKKVNSKDIVDKKLRCVFSMPDSAAPTAPAAAVAPAAAAAPAPDVNATFITDNRRPG